MDTVSSTSQWTILLSVFVTASIRPLDHPEHRKRVHCLAALGHRNDERFRHEENKSSELSMVLEGVIAWFRVPEFARVSVWTAVVVYTDEVEADDTRPQPEDHRRLMDTKIVDDGFEIVRRDGVQLSESVVLRVGSKSGIGDSLDGILIDSSLKKRLVDDPGFEATVFDSRDRYL